MKLPRLLLLVGLAWLTAHATEKDKDPAPAKPPTDFQSLDTDHDGRISLAEFTAPAVKYREARRAKPKPAKPASDIDQDGILSSADTIEGRYSPEVFKQLDIDHDNYVSPKELEALFTSAHNISQP